MKEVKAYHIWTGEQNVAVLTELDTSILEIQEHFNSKYGKGAWSWQFSHATVVTVDETTVEIYQPQNPYIIQIIPTGPVELGQSVKGDVYGHPKFLNGTEVFTSPVLAFTSDGFVTKSHQYKVIKTINSQA